MCELKEVRASLYVAINVNCPHCGYSIDLLWHEDTNGVGLDEDGQITYQVFPKYGSTWNVDGEKFGVKGVECGHCKEPFSVKGLDR